MPSGLEWEAKGENCQSLDLYADDRREKPFDKYLWNGDE